MLRVLTLNLWGTNPPARRRMNALAAYLRGRHPEIVCLQEVAAFAGGTQAHWLAEQSGYDQVMHTSTGAEGLAVLSDFDAQAAATVALPEGVKDHPRALQQVDVAVRSGDRIVRVANTHLAWRLDHGALRRAQAARIAEALGAWTGPVMLAGDLNDVAGSPALAVLTDPAGPALVDCYAAVCDDDRATMSLRNRYCWQPRVAGRRIDHVLARGFGVRDAAVVLTGKDGSVVSDHYGVCVSLEMTP